jgi:acyl carrier protein
MVRPDLRKIIAAHGRLRSPIASIGDEADLFNAGLDSLAVVNVMLAVEEVFEVEFPDELLNRASFSSIAALERAVLEAQAQKA